MVAAQKPRFGAVKPSRKRPRCPHAAQRTGDEGCAWTGVDVQKHINTQCLHTPVPCPHDGCEVRRERRAMAKHAERCKQRLEECPYKGIGCPARLMTSTEMLVHMKEAAEMHVVHLSVKCRQSAEALKKAESTTSLACTEWPIDDILHKMETPNTPPSRFTVKLSHTGSQDASVTIEVRFFKQAISISLTPRLAHVSSSVVRHHNRNVKLNLSLNTAEGSPDTVITLEELRKSFISPSGTVTIVSTLRPGQRLARRPTQSPTVSKN